MTDFVCKKCGSTEYKIKDKNNGTGIAHGLYCAKCGFWHKWIGKDDLRKYEQKESKDDVIKRLESENAELTSKYRQLELTLFTVVRNFKVLPVGLSLGKTKKEITDMTFATIEKIKQSIDYNAVEKLLQGEEE
jgi:hypothetical protein